MTAEREIQAVCIGTSAGGVRALKELFECLPKELNAPILIVQHFPECAKSLLPSILSRTGRACKFGESGELVLPGLCYVAPTGLHMLVRDGHLVLEAGAKRHLNRPAIDPLFRSAAACFGSGLVAILLTGMLQDGSEGMLAVRRRGGFTMAQDPSEAEFKDMPQHAIDIGGAEFVGSIQSMCERLGQFEPDGGGPGIPCKSAGYLTTEAESDISTSSVTERASVFTCPQCGGTLFEELDDHLHFRCRVGHSFTADDLLISQHGNLEEAMWAAIRALEEQQDLINRMIERARSFGRPGGIPRMERRLLASREQSRLLRAAVEELIRNADEGPN